MKLNKKNINDEEREKIESEIKDKMEKKIRLHQTILAATPKAIRDKLFNKRLICYVTNTDDGTHWCCTFVFNIRQYVLNIENGNSLEPSEDIFEIPGYFEFDPLFQPTKYRKTTTKYGLFEYLYIMYEHCWNRRKEIEDRAEKNPIDFKTMVEEENSGFYQMRCETNFITQQYDNHNCSLAVMLAILRFMNAFKENVVSKDWVRKEDNMSKAVIPSHL